MPFVTEELWQRLPRRGADAARSIMLAAYPTADWLKCRDPAAEADMARLQALVKEARAAAAAKGLKPNQAAEMSVSCKVRARCIGRAVAVAAVLRQLRSASALSRVSLLGRIKLL